MLLAYAGSPDGEPLFPIAVVCVPLDPMVSGATLFIKNDWEQNVREHHRIYLQDTFRDWLELMEIDGASIPPQIVDLSVGPLRTVAQGDCNEQETTTLVDEFLTPAHRRFASPS